jgi:hypothetical protein
MDATDDKPVKHIELTHKEWEELRESIKRDYGQSTVMLSWKMKEALGFTVREHQRWDDRFQNYDDRRSVICLDFVSEQHKIVYLLKYS